MFFIYLYVFFDKLKIDSFISDDSTADKKLNKLFFSSEEAAERF